MSRSLPPVVKDVVADAGEAFCLCLGETCCCDSLEALLVGFLLGCVSTAALGSGVHGDEFVIQCYGADVPVPKVRAHRLVQLLVNDLSDSHGWCR